MFANKCLCAFCEELVRDCVGNFDKAPFSVGLFFCFFSRFFPIDSVPDITSHQYGVVRTDCDRASHRSLHVAQEGTKTACPTDTINGYLLLIGKGLYLL